MIRLLKALFIYSILLLPPKIWAQQTANADSLIADTTQQITTAYLLQQKEQQRADSIIGAQLRFQLQQEAVNSKKSRDIENQLNQIAQRDSLREKNRQTKIDQLKKTAIGFPVKLLSDTLFYIYTTIGSFNAQQRATAVSQRLENMYEDGFFDTDSLSIMQSEFSYDVMYREETIVSITDLDALWFNKTPQQLAQDYLNKIRDSITKYKEANSFKNWVWRIVYILLVLIGIWVIIFLINKLFKYTATILERKKDTIFKGFSFRNNKIINPRQLYVFTKRLNNVVRIAVIILSLYLALPALFYILPQTKPFADTLISWILTPAKSIFNSVIHFLPNFFTILVIYYVTTYLVKAVKYFTSEIDKGNLAITGFYKDWAYPTYNIVRVLIYAFMFVLIFPYLPGSHSAAFQGVTVFLGVLVSLGSSSAISNLVAGLVITYMRPFKIGDRVKIGDVTGDVIEKTMLVTRIRTIKNEDITVPNSNILSSHTINYSVNSEDIGLIIHTTVTIGYDVPWKDMHQALIDAALRTEGILKEQLPFVLQTSLDDFYVSYQINAYTKQANRQAFIYSELHKNIQDVCNEKGIEIMSPHYGALRDGNATTIPADYLRNNQTNAAFNVHVKNDSKE